MIHFLCVWFRFNSSRSGYICSALYKRDGHIVEMQLGKRCARFHSLYLFYNLQYLLTKQAW